MSIFNKKKILVTHNGAFHTDDLFASAALFILNKGNVKIIRTRDFKIIAKGDYVYDVSGEYDGKRYFDHHQKGGAGARPNGIPYSSFGLIWKAFGEEICGDKEIADRIDQKIVQPIDAVDNGVDVTITKFEGVEQYNVNQIFMANYPTWKENPSIVDKVFKKEVKKIIPLLEREIKVAKDDLEGNIIILKAYEESSNKKIIVIEKPLPRYLIQDALPQFPEPVYFLYPSGHSDSWKVEAVRKDVTTHESRKLFPESWRGLMNNDPELVKATGIKDIQFCHASGFFLHTKTKEGALKLAEKALLA